ncbi:hypothetical protein M378DRAFT_627756 [Amanita muscaria Koide BX008]|uniref:Uncharacterized protein n=1 Tax=Amanita muscaria (strain Koide BX008) TaxID=946122 RepID=A0A0C2WR87_AMAMK|nr:hypothetical protein M378DRAFT_627756 [Amanita muscaria Koide BX008]
MSALTSQASSTSLLSNHEIQNFSFNKQASNERNNTTTSNAPTSNGPSIASSNTPPSNQLDDAMTPGSAPSPASIPNHLNDSPASNVSSPQALLNLQLNDWNRAATSPQASPMLPSNQIDDSLTSINIMSPVSAATNITPPVPAPLSAPLPSASASPTSSTANSPTDPDPARIPTPAINSEREAPGDVIPAATAVNSTTGLERVDNGGPRPRPLSGPPANGMDFIERFGQPRARPLSVPFMLNAPPVPQVETPGSTDNPSTPGDAEAGPSTQEPGKKQRGRKSAEIQLNPNSTAAMDLFAAWWITQPGHSRTKTEFTNAWKTLSNEKKEEWKEESKKKRKELKKN